MHHLISNDKGQGYWDAFGKQTRARIWGVRRAREYAVFLFHFLNLDDNSHEAEHMGIST